MWHTRADKPAVGLTLSDIPFGMWDVRPFNPLHEAPVGRARLPLCHLLASNRRLPAPATPAPFISLPELKASETFYSGSATSRTPCRIEEALHLANQGCSSFMAATCSPFKSMLPLTALRTPLFAFFQDFSAKFTFFSAPHLLPPFLGNSTPIGGAKHSDFTGLSLDS